MEAIGNLRGSCLITVQASLNYSVVEAFHPRRVERRWRRQCHSSNRLHSSCVGTLSLTAVAPVAYSLFCGLRLLAAAKLIARVSTAYFFAGALREPIIFSGRNWKWTTGKHIYCFLRQPIFFFDENKFISIKIKAKSCRREKFFDFSPQQRANFSCARMFLITRRRSRSPPTFAIYIYFSLSLFHTLLVVGASLSVYVCYWQKAF